MTINMGAAINAYAGVARGAPGMEAREAKPGASFANMLEQVGADAVEAGRKADEISVAAVEGKADVAEVVTAVANAELALQTVVAVRDQVITAYQEIMRMPI